MHVAIERAPPTHEVQIVEAWIDSRPRGPELVKEWLKHLTKMSCDTQA